MVESSFFDSVRLVAFNSVVNPDDEYALRHIFRWYSKTFHTPLHQVCDIPLIDVLLAYYEESFEKMEEQELREERLKMSMTPEEWAEKLRNEEMEELAFVEAIKSTKKMEEVTKPEQKAPIIPSQKPQVKQEEVLDDGFSMSFEDIPI